MGIPLSATLRLLPFLLLLTGCGGGESSTSRPWGEGFGESSYIIDVEYLDTIHIEQNIKIGGFFPDLGPIRWFGVDSAGYMVVAQAQDHLVQVVGPRGQRVSRLGAVRSLIPGTPMDLRGHSDAGLRGDTVWVNDVTLARIALYSRDGKLLRTLAPLVGARPEKEEEDRYPSFLNVAPLAVLPGDTLLITASNPMGALAQDSSWSGPQILRISPEGTILSLLGRLPETGRRGAGFFGGQGKPADTGGIPVPIVGMVPGGMGLGSLTPGAEGGAEARSWRLRVLDAHGGVLADRTITFTGPWRPVGVVMGSDRRIWVEVEGGGNGRVYLVLGPGGDPLGKVSLAGDSRLLAADEGRMWVEEAQGAGGVVVVEYRLRRTT